MKKLNLNNIRKILLYISIFIIIISTIVLIKNKFEIIELIFSTIFISLSINIISSLILIFLLDKRKEEEQQSEYEKKQLLIVNNLLNIVKGFNDLIANMYKATMKEFVQDDDNILKDLYYDVDILYNQINKIDLNKQGYIAVPTDDIFTQISLDWKDCYIHNLKEYIKNIIEIKKYYFSIIDSELMNSIDKIIQSEKGIQLITNSICKDIVNVNLPKIDDKKLEEELIENGDDIKNKVGKFAFIQTNLRGIIIETNKICKYIDNITNKKNFLISKEFFNNTCTAPKIGSGLIDKYN